MQDDRSVTPQLSFIGQVLCVFSHEINNQLAILKESVGLIGDMIDMGKTSRKDLAEISNIVESITNQIRKTAYFCGNLSGFGHSMSENASFAPDKSIEELLILVGRFVTQKKIVVEKEFRKGIPVILGNPLKFQFLLFYFLERTLARLERGGRIIIRTSESNGAVVVEIIPKGTFVEAPASGSLAEQAYESVAASLGARVSPEDAGGRVTITIPVQRPG